MEKTRRLFTFLFPTSGGCEEKEMYYRDEETLSDLFDGELRFREGANLSFDTYFNVFDYAVYRDDTAINEIAYVLSLQGNLTLQLRLLCPAEKKDEYQDILLSERDFSSPEKTEIRLPLSFSHLPEKGTIYLAISAHSDGAFFGGYIEAEAEPLRSVKIGVAITTFKREAFVKRNVAAIMRDLPQEEFGVFVVDNGATLTQEDVPGAHLFPNKNLGGSGGFARGIYEICRNEAYTHILLTDDDISFESEIFRRTAAILRYATDPDRIILGASMLFLDKPYIQHEFGSRWNGRCVLSQNKKKDMRKRTSLLLNASAKPAQYTAWWFNCFSVSLPKRIGLPFPFFIKIDDVEYCLRANCKILLLNGIGVWHESFENKFSAILEYYSKRNELILNALLGKRHGMCTAFRILLRGVSKQLIFQHYFALDLVFKAFDDFLAGADTFGQTDPEKLHAELRPLGERYLSRQELEEQGFDLSRPFYTPQSFDSLGGVLKQIFTLNGHLLPAKKEDYRLIDLTKNVKPEYYYRARRVVQYNPITEKGFVTEQKRGVLFKTGFRLIRYFFKLLFRHPKAARSFRKAFPELISEEAWIKRFDL